MASDQLADRDRDVAEADQLLAQARRHGSIPLPQLTDTDLCLFSDSYATLADDGVWRTWCALPGPERDELAGTAREFLIHRRLLRPLAPADQGALGLAVQPKLGYVLAARLRPAVLGVCSVPGQLRVGDLRMFVLADETHSDPVVVLERTTARGLGPLGRIREYALAVPEAAGGAAAEWVRRSCDTDLGAAGLPRAVDFYTHRDDEPLTAHRLSVLPEPGHRFVVTSLLGGTVLATDEVLDTLGLAERIALALRGGV